MVSRIRNSAWHSVAITGTQADILISYGDCAMSERDVVVKQGIDDLKAELFRHCEEFERAEFQTLKLEKYKTSALWDIGNAALPLKEALGHGNWEPFIDQCIVEKRIGSKRTMERALKIRKNFPNREDCAGLTVSEAENFSDNLDEVEKNTANRCKTTLENKKRELRSQLRRKKEENQRHEAELAGRFDPQIQHDVEQKEQFIPQRIEDVHPQTDLDDEAADEVLIALGDILHDDTLEVTADEDAAFGIFVQSVGDPDRALIVAATKAKERIRKLFI